jgi:TonB-linked SusC/RagA family outer membrane protein
MKTHMITIQKLSLIVLLGIFPWFWILGAQQQANDSLETTYSVAYGSRTKTNLTAAIATISSDELSKVPVATLGNAIQGFATGLTVLRTVGAEPGWDQPSFYIRGVQTFGGGSAPLVLVDNVERDFSQLDPEEIETFTILKDAAAVAQYGMRGANGVISITTKRGFVGRPVITITSQAGMQSPSRLPEFLGAADYVNYRNMALRNDYPMVNDAEFQSLFLNDPRNNPANYDGSQPYLFATTDWYDTFLKKSAPQQMHNLSFRGGSEVARYYVMLGVLQQQGLYQFTKENTGFNTQNIFSRYNFRSVVDVNISNNLTVGVNLAGRVENRHTPNSSAGDIITSLSKLPPTMPYLNEDNSIAGSSTYRTNPYGLISRSGFADRFNRYLQGTTTADLKLDKLLNGLSANALFGFDAYKHYGRSKDQRFAVYQQNLDGSYTPFGEDSSLDINFSGWGSDFSLMMNYMAGLSYRGANHTNMLEADLKYMQSSLAVDGNQPEYRNQGVFGRGTYTYDRRYTAEVGFAYNGSENFAKGSRFGFFPSVSAAWVISNEAFMEDQSMLQFLKLRGSLGKVGNSNIGVGYRFPYEELFYSGGGYYFGTSNTDGAYEGRIPNPAITWEESLNANVGIDVELLRSLSVNLDVFRNHRSRIITGRWNTLPAFIGQDLPYDNVGEVLTRGVEMAVIHSRRIGELGYHIRANVSYATNIITRQEEVQGMNDWEYRAGRAVMQQWGLQVADQAFFADQNEIDGWAKSTYGTVQPGDVKYIDQNKDGVIDEQDYVPLGHPSVPEWNLGLNLGLSWNGIDLNVLLTGIANRSMFISNSVVWGLQENNNITREVAGNSWGVSANPLYPRLTTQRNQHNYQPSSMWQYQGNYLRIQTLELGYTLPDTWLKRMEIEQVRFFVNGYNLFSFDHLRSLNLSAEVPNAGVTLYPETRIINIGTSLKF